MTSALSVPLGWRTYNSVYINPHADLINIKNNKLKLIWIRIKPQNTSITKSPILEGKNLKEWEYIPTDISQDEDGKNTMTVMREKRRQLFDRRRDRSRLTRHLGLEKKDIIEPGFGINAVKVCKAIMWPSKLFYVRYYYNIEQYYKRNLTNNNSLNLIMLSVYFTLWSVVPGLQVDRKDYKNLLVFN